MSNNPYPPRGIADTETPTASHSQKRQNSQVIVPNSTKRSTISNSYLQQLPPRTSTTSVIFDPRLATPTPLSHLGPPSSPTFTGMLSKHSTTNHHSHPHDSEAHTDLNDVPNTESPESITEAQQRQVPLVSLQDQPLLDLLQHQVPVPQQNSQQQLLSQLSQQNSQQQPQLLPQLPRIITEEEQVLASKLQETYRCIVKLEAECQRGCIELNNRLFQNETSEISPELWAVYRNIITLLDFYYDFLLYALRPSSARAGKQIVSIYKIPRRMWVYGIVGFLEVLKNVVTVFIEHEICAAFIAYAFNIISCLTDASLYMEGWWAEKLGDLSRMAIALYPSRYMDWKRSSEYWYQVSMKTQYGHGKIYYHMSTVQQDNLDLLVNIGKSVTCRDAFVPTLQYLRMVVDNICNQRNLLSTIELAVIDFIKIHKIMLLPTYNENIDMLTIVSNYSKSFGIADNGVSFFELTNQSLEATQFWFQKGGNFLLCNINHLIGFGEACNPFAKLFRLPELLRERKERKDKKRKSKGSDLTDEVMGSQDDLSLAGELSQDDWFDSVVHVNKGAVELSMRMLRLYAVGPKPLSYSHVLVWLYFVVAVGENARQYPQSQPFFNYWVRRFLPWVSLVQYLNDLLHEVRHLDKLKNEYLLYLGSNKEKVCPDVENLPEIWKCWGSLWFDSICKKYDYSTLQEAGVQNGVFDIPLGGPFPDLDLDRARKVRILVLAKHIADNFLFDLCISDGYFKIPVQNDQVGDQELARSALLEYRSDPRFNHIFDNVHLESALYTKTIDPLETDEVFVLAAPALPAPEELHSQRFVHKKLRSRSDSDSLDDLDVASIESEADDELDDDALGVTDRDHGAGFRIKDYYLSLDTNIFLKHIGLIFKAITAKAIRIAIPLVVFQELRSLRRSPDPGVSDAATRAVIAVRQIFADYSAMNLVIALKFDGSLTSSLSDTSDFENHSNWRINADELIIRSVKGLNKKYGNTPVYMITDDKNLKIRSNALGVHSHTSRWFTDMIKNYN